MQKQEGAATRIKEIKFKGFKSFSRERSVPFYKGMTAIIGDNGSGKSNILDGLSFVFGRRSSKLRAERMTQLIFNGGENGSPADYALVEVTLDNSSGIFDEFLEEEEAEEITVGRKITQAGSSMYRFQGSNCKRKKIDRIAETANIDPAGYHFVRQGKVTEIVEQSGTERRKTIDDLAGITEFDEKKEEALEELEEVEEHLKEQEIKLDQKQARLNKLEDEKEQALKYRELEKKKRRLEASKLEVRKRALAGRLSELNTDVSSEKEELEEIEDELEEIDGRIEEKQERIEEIDEKQSKGSDVEHLENRIEKKKGEIENKRKRISDLEDQIEELERMSSSSTSNRAVDAVLSQGWSGVHGAFQDLITVEEKYGVAIETAAAGHLDDVVVDDSDTATKAINYLKRESIGRARMLPMEKIDDRSRSAKSRIALKKKGVIGYAADLVDYQDRFEKAVNYVFSDTLIAEDLDSVKDVNGVRVVTLDGDKMSRGGAMTGGKKKKRRGSNKGLSKSLDPEEKRQEKQELEEEVEDLQKDVAELKKMKEKKEKEEETNEQLIEEKKELREELKGLREERQELFSKQQELETSIDEAGRKQANFQAELENVKEKLEEYDFEEEDLEGLDESPEELESRKQDVVSDMNGLAPVNMRSIEEYKELKEEYDEFKDQVSEIRQEKLEIEDLIEEIESEKRERFMQVFERINESFQEIFTELFGGGNGELVLEDDDINKGLKIRAAPPDKDPHIIQALSGGEKTLTAIAFVFAILEYEEAPFYIMDEIDAALDDTNSKKLSELLKDYASENQFIVISHNDVTVRHADRAYGVSMRNGRSKISSIEL